MEKILDGELDVYNLFLEGKIDEISVYITKIINNFIENIESLFPDSCLVNLHENMEELYVEIDSNSIDYYALYDTIFNTITICGLLSEETLYHELFHMSSRLPNSNVEFGGCGFTRYEGIKMFDDDIVGGYNSIGDGITEGYTDLLTSRYFDGTIYYELENRIAYLLEKIIGRDKMELYYMNSDVDSLMSLLGDNGFQLIKDVDYLFLNKDDDQYFESLERAGKLLLQLCIDNKKELVNEFINLLNQFGILEKAVSLKVLKENGIYDECQKRKIYKIA